MACSKNNIDVVRIVLDHGATMQSTSSGTTPLTEACSYGHMDMIELLVENGADVNPDFDVFGFNPIVRAAREHHDQVVRYLLRHGADPFVYSKVRR